MRHPREHLPIIGIIAFREPGARHSPVILCLLNTFHEYLRCRHVLRHIPRFFQCLIMLPDLGWQRAVLIFKRSDPESPQFFHPGDHTSVICGCMFIKTQDPVLEVLHPAALFRDPKDGFRQGRIHHQPPADHDGGRFGEPRHDRFCIGRLQNVAIIHDRISRKCSRLPITFEIRRSLIPLISKSGNTDCRPGSAEASDFLPCRFWS